MDDGQIKLFHAAAFEQFTVRAKRAQTFGEEIDAGRFGVEPVDEAEIFQVARTGPEITRVKRGLERKLQIAARVVPGIRREHPAGGLVEREHGTVFKKNGDDDAPVVDLDVFWFGHGEDYQVRTERRLFVAISSPTFEIPAN